MLRTYRSNNFAWKTIVRTSRSDNFDWKPMIRTYCSKHVAWTSWTNLAAHDNLNAQNSSSFPKPLVELRILVKFSCNVLLNLVQYSSPRSMHDWTDLGTRATTEKQGITRTGTGRRGVGLKSKLVRTGCSNHCLPGDVLRTVSRNC